MKAILMDFGGTLDTNGIHWAEKFAEIYSDLGVTINKENLREAFIYSERMVTPEIQTNTGFLETYKRKAKYQLKFLHSKNILTYIDKIDDFASLVATKCYAVANANINNAAGILSVLKKEFKIAIVSNYYGNLAYICNEFRIHKYFDVIVDSAIVGVRKPDVRIFQLALKNLCVDAKHSYSVGDSYEKDIVPPKQIGCKTIWLKNKSWSSVQDNSSADYIIKNFSDLKEICIPRKMSL